MFLFDPKLDEMYVGNRGLIEGQRTRRTKLIRKVYKVFL